MGPVQSSRTMYSPGLKSVYFILMAKLLLIHVESAPGGGLEATSDSFCETCRRDLGRDETLLVDASARAAPDGCFDVAAGADEETERVALVSDPFALTDVDALSLMAAAAVARI